MPMVLRVPYPDELPIVPTDLTGLVCWFKADVGTFQNSNGTTAASANDDPVGYWADQSGNNYHATQNTAEKRPLLKTGANGINGRSVLSSGGTRKITTGTVTHNVGTGSFWWLCVFRLPVVETQSRNSLVALDNYGPSMEHNGSGLNQYYNNVGGNSFNTTFTQNTVYLLEFGRDSSGTAKFISYVNGTHEANEPTTTAANSIANATLTLFSGAAINASNADIGEFLFYANKPSDANLDKLRQYLNGRWAVY